MPVVSHSHSSREAAEEIVRGIAAGKVSKSDYSAQIRINFSNPHSPSQKIRQIVPLSSVEITQDGSEVAVFLRFIPEKLTYYACRYNNLFTPIKLDFINKVTGEVTALKTHSAFFLPKNQEDNLNDEVRVATIDLRAQGYLSPLTEEEWFRLRPEQTDGNLFPQILPSATYDTVSGNIGFIGKVKNVYIKYLIV